MNPRAVVTACPRDCYDTCFIEVDTRTLEARASPLNPVTQGFLCPRGRADKARVLSEERVLYPHVRASGKGSGFVRASWDEALDLVASRLRRVLEEHGPESVLHVEYAGNMGLLTWYYPQRLWNRIGAARTDYSICSRSGHEALSLHYGLSYGRPPEDMQGSRLLVFWGFNAAVSAVHLWQLALKARSSGALIATVDPRRSETAKRSDLFVQVKPGTDVALAYGVAREIIEMGLVDEVFVARYTYGFEEFKEEALRWTPERVESITGVPPSTVRKLAESYGALKPSVTLIGFGVQKSRQGAEVVRAVSLIPALVGVHRGFYYSNSRGFYVNYSALTLEDTYRPSRVVSQVALADLVERGEFKFIFIYNSNPALTLPRSDKLARGFSREDVFLVVHDTHWTETARMADVVLPAPTFYEKDDVVIPYSHRYVVFSRRALEPLGESRDEVWLTCALAERLGLPEVCADPIQALRSALEGALEGSFEDLLSGRVLRLRYRPLDEYQTPSGRIELYSTAAAQRGLSPLPVQAEAGGEGFVLLNTALPLYTHTQFRDVYGEIPPVVHVNPEDARSLGLAEGEVVEVFNENGVVELRVHVTSDVPRGVLWSPRELVGLNGNPQNVLVSAETQPIGGGPVFNSTTVIIRKKELATSPLRAP
ncbi:molybdopterin-dependent oxidoreductase [Infirmifilum sp. NZ]|uniref:molybdopterin-dependent oxidoreductase n=1 Tax=Infirmifilum sp. NZ TaxID=2926850 RepID=UPI0027A53AC1|nr:molybdopterin-dependent oxidoreductase [Infirmifilum sp. NZ]UNQ73835.1 molybdopterin-dependent oxidoreductase [Infirmifilum sp. NZ]